jgi:hypothetical protein
MLGQDTDRGLFLRLPFPGVQEPGSLWIHSVPQEVIDSTPDLEKKRQEAINEVFYTERDFVRDLEYLRDVCFRFPVAPPARAIRH